MKAKVLTGLIFCLCLGTLFLSSSQFVNVQVTPKWYFAVFMGMLLALTAIAFLFSGQRQKSQYRFLLSQTCFIITVLCVAQSMYGLLQYFGVLPAATGFRVTGSFDNPAGFAASLCAGVPAVFYPVLKNRTLQNWITAIAAAIIVTAVLLSGSRSGMASVLAVGMAISIYEFPKNRKLKVILFSAVLLLFSGLYFLKKDSADGRLLIWRCSLEMIQDKPLSGHGSGGFKAGYMNYQAEYFEENPDSKYAMLADNVNRPFNEYILLLTNYGIAGFVLFLAGCWFLWRSFLRGRHEPVVRLAGCCLLSVAVFAFFSYPLTYPFVWTMMILSITVIIYHAKYPVKIPGRVLSGLKLLSIPAILFFGWKTYQSMSNEMLWCKIARQSLSGKTEQMLPEYERLRPALSGNELFLYNYTAELNVVKNYDKSLQVGKACEQLLADYDLQMLMADNCRETGRYADAEHHFKKAAAMCPVRFMPLYQLAELYKETGQDEKAVALARKIMDKEVKIPSAIVTSIKNKMRKLLEIQNNRADDTTQSAEKPINTSSWQDCRLDSRSPRALLPT
ncbi:MAG: O-antigen ligase family protein [Prevotellaceae bacterium]|jgi:O-antigen ligase|nr:O-antigen ligase family protein [Prevotellaceae bacterium]